MVNAVSQLAQRGLADEAAAFLEKKKTPDVAETVAQRLERLRVNAAAARRLADELENELRLPTGGGSAPDEAHLDLVTAGRPLGDHVSATIRSLGPLCRP